MLTKQRRQMLEQFPCSETLTDFERLGQPRRLRVQQPPREPVVVPRPRAEQRGTAVLVLLPRTQPFDGLERLQRRLHRVVLLHRLPHQSQSCLPGVDEPDTVWIGSQSVDGFTALPIRAHWIAARLDQRTRPQAASAQLRITERPLQLQTSVDMTGRRAGVRRAKQIGEHTVRRCDQPRLPEALHFVEDLQRVRREPLSSAGPETLLALGETGVEQVERHGGSVDRRTVLLPKCAVLFKRLDGIVEASQVEAGVGQVEQNRAAKLDRSVRKDELLRALQGPIRLSDIPAGPNHVAGLEHGRPRKRQWLPRGFCRLDGLLDLAVCRREVTAPLVDVPKVVAGHHFTFGIPHACKASRRYFVERERPPFVFCNHAQGEDQRRPRLVRASATQTLQPGARLGKRIIPHPGGIQAHQALLRPRLARRRGAFIHRRDSEQLQRYDQANTRAAHQRSLLHGDMRGDAGGRTPDTFDILLFLRRRARDLDGEGVDVASSPAP